MAAVSNELAPVEESVCAYSFAERISFDFFLYRF